MTSAPTPQQLSVALSLVDRSSLPPGAWVVLEYVRGATIDCPLVGQENYLAVSSATLATRTGLSPSTVIKALRRLVERRVLIRHWKGFGSAPSLWSINGDLERWAVRWRRDRQVVLQHLALLSTAPHIASQLEICRAPYVARETEPDGAVPRLLSLHQGDFAARATSRGGVHLFRAAHVARLAAADPDVSQLFEVPSELLLDDEKKKGLDTPQAAAVLAAVHEISGRDLFDEPRRQVVEAVGELDDVGHVVRGLRAGGPQPWKSAVAAVLRLAALPPDGPDGPAPARVAIDPERSRLESRARAMRLAGELEEATEIEAQLATMGADGQQAADGG